MQTFRKVLFALAVFANANILYAFWPFTHNKKSGQQQVDREDYDSKKISKYSRVDLQRCMSPEGFNYWFKKGVLRGKGAEVIQIAKEEGVDPLTLASIMANESTFASSRKARKRYNFGGVVGGKYAHADTPLGGVRNLARYIKTRYLDRNINTIASIAAIYAPPGADNDGGQNKNWPRDTVKLMNMIQSKGSCYI